MHVQSLTAVANSLVRNGEINIRQTAVLLACANAEKPLSVKHLADGLGIPKPAVTRALDALVSDDLVTRTESRFDRRLVEIRVTKAGTARIRKLAQDAA